ncbi:zinc finger domain-containing protein [Mycolicibacterium mageritense]|uniref:zinc finger domain-containing protein n=1 Tax=Mycolicibacterium mageritense TaxID=53462 RepID=UPI001E487913|nr:hypothetical protein [Mycolicibacterium mageritense]GJJ23698.1 hypothetical protein MTY414_73710 [Mycolicibacterium mageritense]
MARGDYRHRPRNWRNDPEMVQLHRMALTVDCRYCKQPPGEACVHLDHAGRPQLDRPLENLPCHPVRENDAKRGPKQL